MIVSIIKNRNKMGIILISLIIILIRLPPFYFLSHNIVLMSHNIARVIIAGLSILTFFYFRPLMFKKNKILILLILFYFFSQSISILNTINYTSFLIVYKDIVWGLLLFYSVSVLVNKNNINTIIKVFLSITVISLFIQLIFYFYPLLFNKYFSNLLYEKFIDFYTYQTNRGRFFGDSFEETLIPLFFLFYFKNIKFSNKVIGVISVGIMIFITTISRWRTKLIMLIFSIFGSLYLFLKKIKNQGFILNLILLLFLFISSQLVTHINKPSVYDRILNTEEIISGTIEGRVNHWKIAFEIGSSSPILGIGLGNYFDNLDQKLKLSSLDSAITRDLIIIDDPHNIFLSIFVSSGLLGLISFSLLIIYFLFNDYKYIKTNRIVLSTFIIIFWDLFLFSLINPYAYFSFLSFFFLLRGIIQGLINNNENSN